MVEAPSRQTERAAAAGVEHATLLFELPELQAEAQALGNDSDQLPEHRGVVARTIGVLLVAVRARQADAQRPSVVQLLGERQAVAAVGERRDRARRRLPG